MLRSPMDSRHALTVLHVSDMHFGRYHRFDGDDGLGSLLDRLRQDLDERRDREGLRPDLVVLSGDFAEYGLKAEFERAQRFAQGLAKLVELPNRRIVMVPGNHDVNWKRSQAYFLTCEDEGVAPVLPYWPKFKHYAEFFERFYEGEPGIAFTKEEPWSFFEYPELGVVVSSSPTGCATAICTSRISCSASYPTAATRSRLPTIFSARSSMARRA